MKQGISRQDSHLHSFLKVPTLKARLKLKGKVCLIDIVSGAFNGAPASSDTRAGKIWTLSALKEREQLVKTEYQKQNLLKTQLSIKMYLYLSQRAVVCFNIFT